mmetsp:Transcript_14803/g.16997  ORF Transcript_14803/g.16997 Transcript_14803/m.16997 type:complete len:340 (+) Transcript_14803:42-1061(+)
MSGRREIEDDKVLVTELGRLVHIVKANEQQRKIITRLSRKQRQAAKKSGVAEVVKTTKTPSGEEPQRARRKRRSVHGGSIRLTFSPAILAGVRQMSTTAKASAAELRSKLSQKRCETSVGVAQAYIASAVSQAVEAGLASDDGKPVSEEGALYLSEQFAIAKNILRPAPVGSRLAQLLGHQQTVPPTKSILDWTMDHVAKERQLLRCPAYVERNEDGDVVTSVTVVEPPMLSPEEESAELAAQCSFHIGEQVLEGSEDVAPLKCIVKLKGPSKKVTTILRTQKSAAGFKLNLVNLLKKEASSLLSKDPVAPPATASGAHSPKKEDTTKKSTSTTKKAKK